MPFSRSAIPFPPVLVQISARNAAASVEARRGKRPGDHLIDGVAAYRTPDGKLHAAYDLYEPTYPEGAEPGLGRISSRLEYYPNDTAGYRSHVTDFRPASVLLAESPEWSNPAVAFYRFEEQEGFLCARSEAELLTRLLHAREGMRIDQKPLQIHGLISNQPPAVFLLLATQARTEIHVAADMEAMAEGIAKRTSWLDLGRGTAAERIDRFCQKGSERGWTVVCQEFWEAEAQAKVVFAPEQTHDLSP